jgi:hypothetical protein
VPEVTIDMIKKLRAQTDASVEDCQKALKKAKGDIFKALQLLTRNGAILFNPEADKTNMAKHLGYSLRSAVMLRNYKALDMLFEKGVDINYNEPNMVNPNGGTPLCVAAGFGDMKMVKYLVEHGADVKVSDARGMRPYTIAVQNDETEMAAYLKNLESEEIHSPSNKLHQLRKYALTDDLLAFLQNDNHRIELSANEFDITEIEFFSLVNTVETTFHGKKLLLLSKVIDGTCCELVWASDVKRIGYIDIEHDVYNAVCSFEEFLENPTLCIVKIADGEYE